MGEGHEGTFGSLKDEDDDSDGDRTSVGLDTTHSIDDHLIWLLPVSLRMLERKQERTSFALKPRASTLGASSRGNGVQKDLDARASRIGVTEPAASDAVRLGAVD